MASRSVSQLKVSDHALVRFLERAGALDIEHLRLAIKCSLSRAAGVAKTLNKSDYTILADGLIYVVKDSVVVNVLLAKNGARTPATGAARQEPLP